jgi:hypothetical protein
MITIQHIYQQAKPRLWYWYTLVAFLFLLTTLFTSHNSDWHLDIGASSTRSFGSTLADSEFTRFFGGTVWYRQIPKGSDIGVPDSITPQIIKVRIIMRYEEAPADIVLQSERLKFALTHAGQYRTYWIYTPPSQHFVMNCDTQRVTVPYLSKYCAALVDIRGTTPLNAANLSRLAIILPLIAWMLVVIVSIWRLVQRSDAAIAIVSVAALLAYYVVQTYPLQIITWRIPLTIFFGRV